jgi:hypothetical protein
MLNNDTDTLNFFIYAFFVLAGVTAVLAVTAVAWVAATWRTGSVRVGSPVHAPAHEVVGVDAEEMPQTA